MPGSRSNGTGSPVRRAAIPSLAIAGIGAVMMAAAVPSAAVAAHPSAAGHHRHASHHLKHVSVKGVVAHHHGRTVTVFAKSAKTGHTTRHNRRVTVTFARSVHHARVKMLAGDRISIRGDGRVSGHRITILKHSDENVNPAPASLFFGTVDAINGNLLSVRERNRDDGDNESGVDRRDGHDGSDDNVAAQPADHGDDGDNSGPGHEVMVDTTNASTTVDGSAATALAVGDTVAILGENNDHTVVADRIFGFTNAPAFVRGDITAINGDDVTIGDDDQGENHHGEDVADDHGDDDATLMVSLAGIPLFLNGDGNTTTSDLSIGDKLVMLGSFDSSGNFTPAVAFAFNGDDDQPCGHNEPGDDG
jgi:hypothetical protein